MLIYRLLARAGYFNDGPGEEGGGAAAPAADIQVPDAEALSDFGLTAEEFKALPSDERALMLADTSGSDGMGADDLAQEHAKALETGQPPQPSPAPTAAPVAAPAPQAQAPAQAPAPQAPAQPPAQPPAQQWQAVNPPPVTDDLSIKLPDLALPPAPVLLVDDKRVKERDEAKTKLTELEDKFNEGEITKEEYRAQKAPLETVVETVNGDMAQDRAALAMHRSMASQSFNTVVQASMEAAKVAGIDYLAEEHKDKLAELDAATRRLSKAGPLLFPGKPAGWYDRWALGRAHEEVGAKYGIKFAAAPAPGAAPAAPAAAPKPRAPADLNALPPTTRGAPPAADPSIAGGEFAHLDNLSGTELEKAVARMSPEQQARYLDI